ncbi:MAG: hypothetical protein LBS60_14570 [Deltaproteobacteria bacterium]|jgi:hypothetical protein|nr:hypothetical protein [Deltaproteobacteria bacterium]
MPILLIIGLLIIVGGLVLFVSWFGFFWALIKALAPLAIIALGGVLTYFGWEERKDRKGAVMDFSSPAEASRYHAEALAYQEKLNSLQDGETEPGSEASCENEPGSEVSCETSPEADSATGADNGTESGPDNGTEIVLEKPSDAAPNQENQ